MFKLIAGRSDGVGTRLATIISARIFYDAYIGFIERFFFVRWGAIKSSYYPDNIFSKDDFLS
ncbi:hypothetical protein M6C35_002539 [Vibrio metschnikovii]|nr:hypothetical protein [Vibrio metschnikovii]